MAWMVMDASDFCRTLVQFPAPTRQITTMYNSSPRVSDILFWCSVSTRHLVHRHVYRQNTHTHSNNKYIYNFFKVQGWAGEMAQQLRALGVLLGIWEFNRSTRWWLTTIYKGIWYLSWHAGVCTCRQSTHTFKKKKTLKNQNNSKKWNKLIIIKQRSSRSS